MTRRRTLLIVLLSVFIPLTAVILNSLIYSQGPIFQSLFSITPSDMATPNSRPVIVVGAGLAGLSASLSALRAGAPSVRLLERAAKPGGNSIKASSGINGAPTRFQPVATLGIDESFWEDTARSAGARLRGASVSRYAKEHREALISTLTNRSASAIDFLVDLGVDLSVVALLGGHSYPRTHRGAGKTPPGAAIVTTLLSKLKEQGDDKFQLLTDCEVTKLVTDEDDKVAGVEYTLHSSSSSSSSSSSTSGPQTLRGPVIFTTGGFAGDTHGLLAKYRPDLDGMPSTNDPRPGAHDILSGVGAQLVDMESVQIHPTGFVDPASPQTPVKFLAAEMLRGEGGILLFRGKRVVNELETREKVSGIIMSLPPANDEASSLRQWDVQLLLDPGAAEAAAAHVGFYLWKGLLQKKKINELDEATKETLRDYIKVVKGEKQDGFGRKDFGHWSLAEGDVEEGTKEVCVGRVTPITHFTMGGAVFNDRAQILRSKLGDEEGEKAIGGLWGAGEITGGLHGDNRLGGSSLLECVVFGRIAGEQAAEAAVKA
ncbi:putative fumarate reductase flavoprotein subunit [Cladorrhinum samala]|uniref:Fumarate reductase n=1 Tax=Cladorrhinum samala TaxID=585594 RepID=A0AAV9HIP0_9PEZI|nr:putative fumarate reductase flavoprotein subunit [Cladorrhinum samala]